jgi:hypothetical protein
MVSGREDHCAGLPIEILSFNEQRWRVVWRFGSIFRLHVKSRDCFGEAFRAETILIQITWQRNMGQVLTPTGLGFRFGTTKKRLGADRAAFASNPFWKIRWDDHGNSIVFAA